MPIAPPIQNVSLRMSFRRRTSELRGPDNGGRQHVPIPAWDAAAIQEIALGPMAITHSIKPKIFVEEVLYGAEMTRTRNSAIVNRVI